MKIGLSGAPSSGKSSVIRTLEERGFRVYREAATMIFEDRLSRGETIKQILSDPITLQIQIHEQKLRQYEDSNSYAGETSFFDTTFVDDIAHRIMTGVSTDDIKDNIRRFRYDLIFFMEHPGRIEENGIRKENINEAMKLDRLKREAILKSGYKLIIVPAFYNPTEQISTAVNKRVNFILDDISRQV